MSGDQQHDDIVHNVDDDDDDDLSSEVCQQLIDEFVAVTQTNDAVAQMFLQQRQWQLQPAINHFFEQTLDVNKKEKTASIVELSSESEEEESSESPPKKMKSTERPDGDGLDNSGVKKGSESTKESETASKSNSNELIFITWNADGISSKDRKVRSEGVISIVKKIQPDVLFLQEVVPESESVFRQHLASEYQIISGREWKGFDAQYYIMTLVRKATAELISHRVVDFEMSVMTRNVIIAKVRCNNNLVINFMNTHLESTKDYSGIRMQQLNRIKKLVLEIPKGEPVIVAGDMNMRDKELEETGGLPDKWIDVWEGTGKRPEAKFTWDMMRNDNLDANFGRFRPRCRFDRVYVCDETPSKLLVPKIFSLIGLERLKPHNCFPSDHWGILTVFNTFPASN